MNKKSKYILRAYHPKMLENVVGHSRSELDFIANIYWNFRISLERDRKKAKLPNANYNQNGELSKCIREVFNVDPTLMAQAYGAIPRVTHDPLTTNILHPRANYKETCSGSLI